ncbi:MAG TPA: DUF4397 domain-containing protein [Chloroflexota bacterium]|nr:DUF4397 domain-containing protein [Chloroflexota bacterium]
MPLPLRARHAGARLLGLFLVAACAGLPAAVRAQAPDALPAPRPTPAAPAAHGQLRVVHAWAGVPAVAVLVDGAPLRAPLAFGADSGYLPLPAGEYMVAVVAAGSDAAAPLLSVAVALAAGAARTLVASPATSGALLLDDLALAPVGGPAIARLVHAAEGAPALELADADGPRLAGPVAPGEASAYADVAPAALTLAARPASGGAPLATIPGAVLVADRSYTFVALGPTSGPLTLLGLVDD